MGEQVQNFAKELKHEKNEMFDPVVSPVAWHGGSQLCTGSMASTDLSTGAFQGQGMNFPYPKDAPTAA